MFQDSNQWRPCHISPTFFNKKRSAVTFTALSSPQLLSGSGRHVQTDVTWHHMLDWLQRYLEQSISCQGHLDERGTKTRGSSFVWKTRTFWKHDHLTTSQSMCFESASFSCLHPLSNKLSWYQLRPKASCQHALGPQEVDNKRCPNEHNYVSIHLSFLSDSFNKLAMLGEGCPFRHEAKVITPWRKTVS